LYKFVALVLITSVFYPLHPQPGAGAGDGAAELPHKSHQGIAIARFNLKVSGLSADGSAKVDAMRTPKRIAMKKASEILMMN
jgi:hypothetical protein